MLYSYFNLKSFEQVKKYVNSYMGNFDGEDLYITRIQLPEKLEQLLNNELTECGLPDIAAYVAFKRRNCVYSDIDFPKVSEFKGMHLDCTNSNEVLHTSLILPISGCEDTFMYYAGGKFDVTFGYAKDGKTARAIVNWLEEPYILDKVSITDTPLISKVNLPHDTNSRADNEYRVTLTLRLHNNPTFDEVYEKFKNSGRIIECQSDR
jgi:hypothetical protein